MITKHESHLEVTLKKSPSGIWGIPESPKRQFKPWLRLWLAAGIFYFLLLAVSFSMLMPDQERIERQMVFSVTEEVKRYDGMAFAGESPRKIFEIARAEGYDFWIAQIRNKYHIGNEGNSGFKKIEKNYREAVADLPMKQMLGVLICFVIWLLPMAVLYAIGFIFIHNNATS